MGNASRLFNGSAEDTLLNRITPTKDQREYLQVWWNALAEVLKERLARHGYTIETWIQGSYKFGTLIRPVHLGEEYDVDLGVFFCWEKGDEAEPAPEQLRDWVQHEAFAYSSEEPEVRKVIEPPKERCSRLVYQKPFHIDLPVYHLDASTDIRRLATLAGKWEDSDPKKLYVWFKNAVGNPERDQLRRVIRYLKGWAAVTFDISSGFRPKSVYLTVLATDAFKAEGLHEKDMDDDDALYRVSSRILERIKADDNVPNPVSAEENLADMAPEALRAFLEGLKDLVDCGERATNAEDEASAAMSWADAFSFLMPLPEVDEIEVVEEDAPRALMVVPNIKIDVTDRKSGRFLRSHMNEVPHCSKDCDLKFTIINPEIIPPFATVEWTVRNHGDEAKEIGDIGHRNKISTGLVAEEHTAYLGKHFMDCVVRHNGQVLALRRIPVRVNANPYPLRNPTRPAWTKVRTIRRRR